MKILRQIILTVLAVAFVIGSFYHYNELKKRENPPTLKFAAPYEYELEFTSHYQVSEVNVTYYDEKLKRECTRTVFVRYDDINNLKSFKNIKFFEERLITIDEVLKILNSNNVETFDEHFCEIPVIKVDNITNLYLYEYCENGYKKIVKLQLRKSKTNNV